MGGKGSSSTTTIDYSYNKRMAKISERQQKMAESYFKFYEKHYQPMEIEQIKANMGLIPFQVSEEQARATATEDQHRFAQEQLAEARKILPQATEEELMRLQTSMLEMEHLREIMPHATAEQIAQLQTSQMSAEALQQIIPSATEEQLQQLQTSMQRMSQERELMPYETAAHKATLGVVPVEAETRLGILESMQQETKAAQPVMAEYYKQALQGIDPERKVAQARADVAKGFSEDEGIIRRQAGRMGIDPGSDRFQDTLAQRGIERAKAIGGGMTTARDAAEQESFSRLSGATDTYKRNYGLGG